MNKKQLITWVILLFMALTVSGCSLLNMLVNAGIAYGLYEATN